MAQSTTCPLRRARVGAARAATVIGLAAVTTAVLSAAPPASAEAPVRPPAVSLVTLARGGARLGEDILTQADAQRGSVRRAAAKARAKKEAKRRAKVRAAHRAAREARARRASRASGRGGLGGPLSSGWTMPVRRVTFSADYGQPGNWSSGYHTGIDFAVPTGTPVRAVGAGTVVTASSGGSYGNNIVIRHPDGCYTHYAHLSSFAVSPGQSVHAGQRIGSSGATGNVTGPHLHFEARTSPDYGSDTNPLAYLRRHGVRF